jgi:hypothetical protein
MVPRLLLLLALVLSPCATWAKPQTVVRVTAGEHPGFGRVVLDAPGLTYAASRDAGHLLIRFSEDPGLGALPSIPRNVLAIRPVPGGVELTVAASANVHTSRMGSKVVVDVDDPVAGRTTPASSGDNRDSPTLSPAEAAAKSGTRQATPSPVQNSGGVPGQVRTTIPAVERHAVTGEPPKVSPPSEPPEKQLRVVVPEHGMARSDSASSMEARLATPAPEGPGAAPLPQTAASTPGAAVAVPPRTGPDTAALPPPAGQPPAEQPPAEPPPPRAQADRIPEDRPNAQPQLPPEVRRDVPAPEESQPLQVWPVTRDAAPSGPVALLATKTRPPGGLAGVAVRIPFNPAVGAALFSLGPDTFVVFDERRPIDLSALRDDPVFGSAMVTIYPTATVIQLTRPPGQSAMLFPSPTGWGLAIVPASPAPGALKQETARNVIFFSADAPGQVVAIADPRTGGTILVGTQRLSGQGILTEQRTPEFILPVTGQGIVLEPLSDAISLRVTQSGFVLSGGPGGLALSPPEPMPDATLAAAGLTRLFEFPRQSTEQLAMRAKRQAVAAAMAPLLTRGPKRHALAQSMLGLGLGAEAQTLLRITMKDDPREAASPATIGLAAIAALLAGRPQEAGDLADPRLTGTDDIALWRAIQAAMADESSPEAAAVLATTAPLLFTYPAQMRHHFLPLALETMILGGQANAAAPLLAQREDDPRLAYARALLLQAQGDNGGALAAFDAVADSRSAFDHARASARATELRLTMGQLDAKGAADALEAGLYAWRGDRRDLALRLRIAELRAQQGAWRELFAGLRAAKADFPAQAAEIDRRLQEAFAAVPRDPKLDKMEPTELIALLEDNAELMADGPEGEPMRVLLADKLMALDLPRQADPLLTKLMRAAPYGPARAGFGATLATLRLREGDGDGAILALSESNSSDMGDAVRDRRALITARVEAKRGQIPSAIEALAGSQTPEAEEARAAILEQAQDWPAARDALAVLVAHQLPAAGMLDDTQQRTVLRLATAATRANDDATLAALRDELGARIGTGPQADMFRLLTAAPVRGTADLVRARAEMGLARAITADMGAKKTVTKTP